MFVSSSNFAVAHFSADKTQKKKKNEIKTTTGKVIELSQAQRNFYFRHHHISLDIRAKGETDKYMYGVDEYRRAVWVFA